MRIVRYTLAGVALAGAVAGLVLAWASLLYAQNTADSSAAAVRLIPFRAEYLVRFAAWHPERKTAILQQAVRLNPFATQAWIDLALNAEFGQNDQASAEHFFLQAAAVDHMFVPKWTLANFYFRHEQEQPFLDWAKQTLAITPYGADPVFSEMWLLVPNDPQRVASAVPDAPNILWQYAWYLAKTQKFAAIPPVVARLVKVTNPREAENFGRSTILGPITDHLLQAGSPGEALQVWGLLGRAHWIATSAPDAGHPISNGNFGSAIWPHGFDWLPITTPGVATEQHMDAHELQIEFSGDQPDPCVVLQQWVPLAAQGNYTLRWTAKAELPDTAADTAWHLRTGNGQELLASPPLGNANGNWTFTFPGKAGAYLLSLEYARQPGHVRAKGRLTLGNVQAVGILTSVTHPLAGVAELADARDSKSRVLH